ncbi:error-prone DNA polymerase [Stappia sp. F7233]|uniref:Error-prone DNA polymerase n=1 Tax=Stappia albiluteola TaxID=2758565 RepID=A0A839AHN6_9HYPH|nr:error-prone DNA polymerase [Stappia albiluteola]MBA5778548.1 error-prone DNA polymerase [Stappia albiluteola]
MAYAELGTASNFSFLRGASHPEELVRRAAELGLAAVGVADRNSLAGVVRAHMAAKEAGLRFVVGCRLAFIDGTPDILAFPRDREAYGRLTRLLTIGNRRASKGDCHLTLQDLLAWGEGIILVPLARPEEEDRLPELLAELVTAFGKAVRLGVQLAHGGSDQRRLARLSAIAQAADVPLLATNDVLYHLPERRPLQDVLTCIRLHETLESAGRRLLPNAERHLKGEDEMARLFRAAPGALAESLRIVGEITFSLDELKYEYPEEDCGPSATPQEELERLARDGLARRYPAGAPKKVLDAVAHELALIEELQYARYFLTVNDIVRFARSQGILCQGRGSAANSAVCFCLGITEVDPERADLLFERFISPERREPPDIDVDFEHERREEVIQYIYRKYGRDRAGLAATVITYRSRSAIREVGKVLGLSDDVLGHVAGTIWGWSSGGVNERELREAGLDPADPRLLQLARLCRQIIGFPRHLSQHVGGFVITRGRLDEVVPVMNAAMEDRTNIEWDKDDLESLGMLKIDVLALGMLTAIRKSLDLLKAHYGEEYSVSSIPAEEPEVYDMLCEADSIGVFQVESRAQMTMLPRLRPRNFYDLVIEVAIVRPGPIQGDMVHPYLRRRQELETVTYPKKELEEVLGKTLGVPLFQEQAMKIAIVAAGFTPGEADRLRRAMATFKRVGTIATFQKKMVEGMVARGYERDFAERCFRQIEGFGEYGFPESHAASFALLVYASAWIKARYPDVFLAGMLNAQPLGFYAPAQLVRDARDHGVEVREADINLSNWDATLEPGVPAAGRLHPLHAKMRGTVRSHMAVRLGLRQIKGLKEGDVERLIRHRGKGYDSVRDLWLRSGLSRMAIERLAEADAFRSLGLDRRTALWAAQGLEAGGLKERLPLFDTTGGMELRREPDADLPPMRPGEQVIADYRTLTLSLKAHPVSFVRKSLAAGRIRACGELRGMANNGWTSVAGLVLVRQRPGTASGVIFMTMEDETGVANVVVWPKVFEQFRAIVLGSRFVKVTGKVQSQDGVIHLIATRLEDMTPLLSDISGMPAGQTDLKDAGLSRADEVKHPVSEDRRKPHPPAALVRLVREVPEIAADIPRLEDIKPANDAFIARRPSQQDTVLAMPRGRNFH